MNHFSSILTAVKGTRRQYRLGPLVTIIGENGGGKSAVTQSVQLLASKSASGIRGRDEVKDIRTLWEMFSSTDILLDVSGVMATDSGNCTAAVSSAYNSEKGTYSRLAVDLPSVVDPDFVWLQPALAISAIVKAGGDKAGHMLVDLIIDTVRLAESQLEEKGLALAEEKDWVPPASAINPGLAYWQAMRDNLKKQADAAAKSAKAIFGGSDHSCPACDRALGDGKRSELDARKAALEKEVLALKAASDAIQETLKRETLGVLAEASAVAVSMFPRMYAAWGVPTLAHGGTYGILGLSRAEEGLRRTALCGLEGVWAELAMGLALYSLSEGFGEKYSFFVWPDIDVSPGWRQALMADLAEGVASEKVKTQVLMTSCVDVAAVDGWSKVDV